MKTPDAARTLDSRIFQLNGDALSPTTIERLSTADAVLLHITKETPWQVRDVLGHCRKYAAAVIADDVPIVQANAARQCLAQHHVTPYMSTKTALTELSYQLRH